MFHYLYSIVMMCSFASVVKKERSRYELTLLHLIISSLIQCHKKILLSIILIYFRTHIYSLELHHSNQCFYLMKTPVILLALSRCPWYMRTKRQSPSNIFLTILIYFLAQYPLEISTGTGVTDHTESEYVIFVHRTATLQNSSAVICI